jgi:hypothetical protein
MGTTRSRVNYSLTLAVIIEPSGIETNRLLLVATGLAVVAILLGRSFRKTAVSATGRRPSTASRTTSWPYRPAESTTLDVPMVRNSS